MTPGELLAKAEHAILTGQPNLAMLYLGRADEILDERAQAHQTWKARHVFANLGRALAGLPVAFETAARAISDMVNAFQSAAADGDFRIMV